MCFHTREEMEEYERRLLARKNVNPVGFVIMRDKATNAFQEAYFCDVTDEQAIANTIRNLRAWHPGDHVVDLSEVNKKRLTVNMLPVFDGVPAVMRTRSVIANSVKGIGGQYNAGIYFSDVNGKWHMLLPNPTGIAPPSEDPQASVDTEADMVAVTEPTFDYERELGTLHEMYLSPLVSASWPSNGIVSQERFDAMLKYESAVSALNTALKEERRRKDERSKAKEYHYMLLYGMNITKSPTKHSIVNWATAA